MRTQISHSFPCSWRSQEPQSNANAFGVYLLADEPSQLSAAGGHEFLGAVIAEYSGEHLVHEAYLKPRLTPADDSKLEAVL